LVWVSSFIFAYQVKTQLTQRKLKHLSGDYEYLTKVLPNLVIIDNFVFYSIICIFIGLNSNWDSDFNQYLYSIMFQPVHNAVK
jgi:hypothetical protein